jgi:hypothetical protein
MSIGFYLLKKEKVKISDEEILNSNNIVLMFRFSNMRSSYYYIFTINEVEKSLKSLGYKDEVLFETDLDNEDISKIKNAIVSNRVNTWDGFDKADNRVSDGEMFTLDLKINDIKIYANGSNSFPKNYREFKNKINEIIKKYDIIN